MGGAICLLALVVSPVPGEEPALRFRSQEIETGLEVGYAVRLLDMNDDGRLDIVVVDSRRLVWYENPSWEARPFLQEQTKADNVCFAPHDIDGDGRVDFALGADWRPKDTSTSGTIQWISRAGSPGGDWQLRFIAEEPTTHRMQWANIDDDPQPELLVLPLFGRDTTGPKYAEQGVRLLAFHVPEDPTGRWPMDVIDDGLHVCHNFWPTDLDDDGQTELLVASFEGVSVLDRQTDGTWQRRRIGEGNQQTSPNTGASEIKRGMLAGGGDYLATIEPWHGTQVVVYTRPTGDGPDTLWPRQVLDEDLQWGHAVWCANLDDDADEELIIGVRDDRDEQARCGVRIYDPQDNGQRWSRLLVEPGAVAVEDLAAADLDGDGRIDLVAAGRATHNVRIYWNEAE